MLFCSGSTKQNLALGKNVEWVFLTIAGHLQVSSVTATSQAVPLSQEQQLTPLGLSLLLLGQGLAM